MIALTGFVMAVILLGFAILSRLMSAPIETFYIFGGSIFAVMLSGIALELALINNAWFRTWVKRIYFQPISRTGLRKGQI